ncbi:protein-L-isoaspartate O-methyltransferase [Pontixanthobacter aestiaquae]|uniref:Protein-L-isoaspartate O-methyltransferase n=1 Tax=Pontixanthobacter aestiaquae TaxID=1509367 RepID=A0A844Z358_9SPHN|nr:protein-L-isoaspartate O-methyltransferase [Pontixanthobacter aestiaquae]MDN3646870.1 protein-L-isoaspartate O-methyltransferase [Pontixanthobacter aestiaquae]MXO82148.1 protein-L-isoaspartate O-methyltransferase [Pontixanthobacter aestiaquae]
MTLTKTKPDSDIYAAARRAMVDSQLRTSGVNDEFVLARMLAVPREDHVPESARGTAYIDRAITLDNGRRIGAPLFYGMVLAEAQPRSDDTVLVVDAGSGYLPALLKPLVSAIDVITPEEAVATTSKRKTYSLIVIDGAVESVPATLAKRMADGGRIVTGLAAKSVTKLAVGRKSTSDVALLPLAELGIPRLAEFDTPEGWSF